MKVLSLGAGVQSTALALLATRGAFDSTGGPPDHAIFADTGWEPHYVHEHLDWLESMVSFPIHRVSLEYRIQDMTRKGYSRPDDNKFVGLPVFLKNPKGDIVMGTRQCTSNYKIAPIRRHIRNLLNLSPVGSVPRSVKVEQWLGISLDEAHRMRDSRVNWIVNRYPLVEANITRRDCEVWLGREYPDRLVRKSACVGCPYHSDATWLELMESAPEQIADAIAVDAEMRSSFAARGRDFAPYLHRSARPLGEVLAEMSKPDYKQTNMFALSAFGNECDGLCDT